MSFELSKVLALIESGADLEDVVRQTLPAEKSELLRRCSLPHHFDGAMFTEVLCLGLDGADPEERFAWIVAHPAVEPVTGETGLFQVRQSQRMRDLETWFPTALTESAAPPPLDGEAARLTREIAEHCASRGREWETERLYHLLAVDPAAARSLFDALYAEADARFDAPTCYYLIELLAERLPLLTPELRELRLDRKRYFDARCYWSDAFYQTSWVYEREIMRNAFAAILGGASDGRWIFEIEAAGGMGKTMFLRWLIARRCVPEPWRIPCARIDFDFQVQQPPGQAPWQLLIRLAEQLDLQIPGSPLRELLDEAGELDTARQYSQGSQGTVAVSEISAPLDGSHSEQLATGVPDRFATALQESVQGPVVLIFDTLEDAFLRYQTDLLSLFRCISAVHEIFPGIRLLLSGRFDLTSRLPGFAEEFGAVVRPLSIPRFDAEEAQGYLEQSRRLPPGPVVDAIVKKGGGVPFKLALLADVVQMREGLEAAEILSYPDADLLYLIERVVRRIEDRQVRWFLRYGVVPRRLTREFVREVMLPHLVLSMSGRGHWDDPLKDLPVRSPHPSDPPFPIDLLASPDQEIPVDLIWDRLVQYASRFSWVTRDERERDALVFHGDVVNPMRRLLQRRPVFHLLHRSAFHYYDERARKAAKEERDEWLRLVREAIYHRFQAGSRKATDYWRQALQQAFRLGRPQWRHALAVEVWSPEYVEDGLPLRRRKDRFLISPEVLFEASFERLRVGLELARSAPPDERESWGRDAVQAWNDMQRLLTEFPEADFPATQAALAQSALLARRGEHEQALSVLRAADQATAREPDHAALQYGLGDLLAEAAPSEAVRHYAEALQVMDKPGLATATERITLRDTMAGLCGELGRLDEALQILDDAVREARHGSPSVLASLLLRRMDLSIRSGRPGQAIARRPHPRSEKLPTAPEARFLCAEARGRLALREPWAALEALSRAAELKGLQDWELSSTVHSQELRSARAEIHETRGLALADLLQLDEALDELELSQGSWRSLGDVEGASRCLAHKLEIHLRVTSHLRHAGQLVEESQRVTLPRRSETWVRLQTLQAEHVQRTGQADEAHGQLAGLLEDRTFHRSPPVAARIALAGVILGGGADPEAYLRRLACELDRMEPPAARLSLLAPLRHAPVLSPVPHLLADKLLRLVTCSSNRQPATGGLPPLALAEVELLRVLGRAETARKRLESLGRKLRPERSPFLVFEIQAACARLGGPPVSSGRHLDLIVPSLQGYPLLTGAACLRDARFSLARGDRQRAERMAGEARAWIDSFTGLPTRLSVDLHLLLADLAASEAQWSRALRSALVVTEELGDQELGIKLQKLLGQEIRAEEGQRAPATVTVRFSIQPEPAVETELPDRPAVRRRLSLSMSRLADDLGADLAEGGEGHAVPIRLLKSLAGSWTQTLHELCDLVFDIPGRNQVLHQVPESQRVDVRFEIGPSVLDALPWELLPLVPDGPPEALCLAPGARSVYRTFPYEHVTQAHLRWIQSALTDLGQAELQADGLPGSATLEAIRSFQRRSGLVPDGVPGPLTTREIAHRLRHPSDRPAVLLLQPSLRRQEIALRGADFFSGGSRLPLLYEDAGFAVDVVEDPDPGAFRNALKSRPYDILHLCAGLRESPSLGGTVLDFSTASRSPKSAAPRGDAFSAISLSRLLADRSALRPIVILDVPRAHGLTECIRQLFLRNAFAAELLRLRNMPAVLAVGLADPSLQPVLYKRLASSLGAGLPIDQVCRALWRTVAEHLPAPHGRSVETELLALAASLFAYDPRMVSVARPEPA